MALHLCCGIRFDVPIKGNLKLRIQSRNSFIEERLNHAFTVVIMGRNLGAHTISWPIHDWIVTYWSHTLKSLRYRLRNGEIFISVSAFNFYVYRSWGHMMVKKVNNTSTVHLRSSCFCCRDFSVSFRCLPQNFLHFVCVFYWKPPVLWQRWTNLCSDSQRFSFVTVSRLTVVIACLPHFNLPTHVSSSRRGGVWSVEATPTEASGPSVEATIWCRLQRYI
jgi:hypothetical protein